MTADEVRELLRARIGTGTQADLARELMVSSAYLSDVLSGSRDPGPVILKALGLRRHVDYIPRRKTK